ISLRDFQFRQGRLSTTKPEIIRNLTGKDTPRQMADFQKKGIGNNNNKRKPSGNGGDDLTEKTATIRQKPIQDFFAAGTANEVVNLTEEEGSAEGIVTDEMEVTEVVDVMTKKNVLDDELKKILSEIGQRFCGRQPEQVEVKKVQRVKEREQRQMCWAIMFRK
ncbi:MAG: hypothetical protein WB421_06740, partial [Terriglobales bacterium]